MKSALSKQLSRARRLTLTERGMQIAERRIPELAARAGRKAYQMALTQTGAVTVKLSDGRIVKRHIDGTVTVIKRVPIGKRVKPGTILRRIK